MSCQAFWMQTGARCPKQKAHSESMFCRSAAIGSVIQHPKAGPCPGEAQMHVPQRDRKGREQRAQQCWIPQASYRQWISFHSNQLRKAIIASTCLFFTLYHIVTCRDDEVHTGLVAPNTTRTFRELSQQPREQGMGFFFQDHKCILQWLKYSSEKLLGSHKLTKVWRTNSVSSRQA